MQGRNRDADVDNVDTVRNKRVGWTERIALIYTTPGVKQTASGQLPDSTGSSARGSVMTQRGGTGEEREA